MTAPLVTPPAMPLEMLLNKIGQDLFLVLGGNGYRQVGFTLIVQDLRDDEMAMVGNLKPDGLEALLENAIDRVHIMQAEQDDEEKPQ